MSLAAKTRIRARILSNAGARAKTPLTPAPQASLMASASGSTLGESESKSADEGLVRSGREGASGITRIPALALSAAAAAALAACGGGGSGGASETPEGGEAPGEAPAPQGQAQALNDTEAARFLGQASMAFDHAEIDAVKSQSYKAWIRAQIALPASIDPEALFLARDAQIKAQAPSSSAGAGQVPEAFWRQALTGRDFLRARATWALSQMLVVSLNDGTLGGAPRMVAAYHGLLSKGAFGSYKDLLLSVALSPAMGTYLTHIKNQKEDAARGTIPDQNFAREIMQLFTLGPLLLDEAGLPLASKAETYSGADVSGLSFVFTGLSWAGPDQTNARFFGSSGAIDPNREALPMQAYPQFHSQHEKAFLGHTIPAGSADAIKDVSEAIDTLLAHPNCAPFVARQMIQRLVMSNPSPAYARRCAAAFKASGLSLAALWEAILLDPEARVEQSAAAATPLPKINEPLLRAARLLRSGSMVSLSGNFALGITDDPAGSVGQTFLKAPSVFNFNRPGFTPSGTGISAAGLLAPEMQNLTEVSAIGFSNWLLDRLNAGVGQEVSLPFTQWLPLASAPESLLREAELLLGAGRSIESSYRARALTAIGEIRLRDTDSATTQAAARLNRCRIAAYLVIVSAQALVSW